MKAILFFTFCILLMTYVYSSLSVISPSNIVKEIKQLEPSLEIKHTFGNFGQIPYGKSILGSIYLQKQSDGSNYWCDLSKTSTPEELNRMSVNEFTPIIIVDHSTGCSYSQKAMNVSLRGGRIMLLVSDKNSLDDIPYNVDDTLGQKIDIPTVIIPKNIGEIFKEHAKKPGADRIVLWMKFTGVKSDGNLEMQLYFRSDDIKSLNFFHEFQYYKNKLGDNLLFTPVYKYNIYPYSDTSSIPNADSKAPCIKEDKFCVSENKEWKITNPRIIWIENLRQSCIYLHYNLDVYWNYMISFSELCADINNPTFNEQCAWNAMKTVSFPTLPNYSSYWERINTCINDMITESSKVEDDYNMYNKNKVFKYPEWMLNGVKYRGSWYSKYIFDSICTGFIEDDEICAKQEEESKSNMIGFTIILSVTVSLMVIMLVLLICYRRVVNRSLEASWNDKIHEQAMKSIGQYKAFKESEEMSVERGNIEMIEGKNNIEIANL